MDPRMALAALELAESYLGRGWAYAMLVRWAPVVFALCLFAMTIPDAIEGSAENAILVALVALGLRCAPDVQPSAATKEHGSVSKGIKVGCGRRPAS